MNLNFQSNRKIAFVIMCYQNQVLICYENRQGFKNLWEFPGGKIEAGESLLNGAFREIKEEVNISLNFLKTHGFYHYHSKKYKNLTIYPFSIELSESQFNQLIAREGQKYQWIDYKKILNYSFLKGSYGAIYRFLLPDCYMITREPEGDLSELLSTWQQQFERGVRLIQLRAKKLSKKSIFELTKKLKKIIQTYNGFVLVNSEIEIAKDLNVGVHLTSKQLTKVNKRVLKKQYLISTSCHNNQEFELAKKFTDIALISPIKINHYNHNHLKNQLISSEQLSNYSNSHLVTYALSGMSQEDITWVQALGAQGIAGISAFEKKLEIS